MRVCTFTVSAKSGPTTIELPVDSTILGVGCGKGHDGPDVIEVYVAESDRRTVKPVDLFVYNEGQDTDPNVKHDYVGSVRANTSLYSSPFLFHVFTRAIPVIEPKALLKSTSASLDPKLGDRVSAATEKKFKPKSKK